MGQCGGMDWGRAFQELGRPKSEINAFLEFGSCLRDQHGCDCCFLPSEGDPPDFWLCIEKVRVGVEVTTLNSCQGVFEANAKVDDVLKFLRSKTSKISVPRGSGVNLLFAPLSSKCIPNPRRNDRFFRVLLDYLRQFVETEMNGGGLCWWKGAIFWVSRCHHGTEGIDVMDQRFFRATSEQDWHDEINQDIMRKVQHYGVSPCKPCWLLLNLKPYFFSAGDVVKFRSVGVQVENVKRVKQVFDRVYALTDYVPQPDAEASSQVVRLL